MSKAKELQGLLASSQSKLNSDDVLSFLKVVDEAFPPPGCCKHGLMLDDGKLTLQIVVEGGDKPLFWPVYIEGEPLTESLIQDIKVMLEKQGYEARNP
jgi:hypothetical protein